MNGPGELKNTSSVPRLKQAVNPTLSQSAGQNNHRQLPKRLVELIDALNPNLHSNPNSPLDSDPDQNPDSDSELNQILRSIDQLLLCESEKIDSELGSQQPFLVWNRFSQAIQFYAQILLQQSPHHHLRDLQGDLQDNLLENHSQDRVQNHLPNCHQNNFDNYLQSSPLPQRSFNITRLKLNLLNACIHSYSQNKAQVDNLHTLCFYRDLYDLLINHPPPRLLDSPAQNYQAIINSISSLDLLTNHGKQIVGCQGIVNLLISIIKPAIDLQLEIKSSASFFRLLTPTPVALILNHAAALLTQITKFSSPQLTTPQVKQIINLFINQIGLSTRSEHALKIVLDYIDCLIVFGYVPNPNSSIPDPPSSPTPADELDGERLLIDLVRFVVKIVGLQDIEAIVDEIGPDDYLAEFGRPAALSAPNHSNSHPDAVPLVITKTTPLSTAIVERAKTCMKDLIRSPSNQAIKSLLSTLTITDASINQWSKIGAIRCLRFAYEDYDYVSTQARPASSLDDNVSAIERSLTLLGLGLLLVKIPLQAIITSPERTTLAIDYEILMLLTDRLQMCLKTSKPAGMISLMKQDDLECCLDLMLLFAQERLKVWLEDPEAGVVDWCLDFDTSFTAPSIQKDDDRQQAESTRSPLIAFSKIFSLLFTYHAAEIEGRGTEKRGEMMSWNLISLDKYFSLCIKMSKYMSSSLKVSLVDQIDLDQVCSPECASWLSHLRALVDGFFDLSIPASNLAAKSGPTGFSASSKLPPAQFQVRLLRLICDVFMEIRDLELWREELLQAIIIPSLSRILLLPRLPSFDDLELVDRAMDFMREIVHNELVNDLLAGQDDNDHRPHRSLDTYDVIRRLLLATAKMGQLVEMEDVTERMKQSGLNHDPYLLTPSELALNPSTTTIVTPSTVPLKASTTTSTTISTTLYSPARPSSEPSRVPPKQEHLFSKRQHELSYKAVVTLIKLFMDGLQISTAYSNAKCAAIFVDLLDLLRSAKDPGAVASASTSITLNDFDHDLQRKVEHSQLGSRAKLAILKCLVRLRADEEHRVQFVRDLEIDGLAGIIGRVVDPLDSRSVQPMVSVPNLEHRTVLSSPDRKPNLSPVTPVSKPRTFSQSQRPPKRASVDEQINANRKVTPISTPMMPPVALRSPTKLSEHIEEKMLWTAPEKLDEFGWAAKIETESTYSLVTYDHVARKEVDSTLERPQRPNSAHHSHHHMTVLPVAEYMAVLIGILRYEADWELVSYVLCHLPGQLSNKHFACEPRASQQIHQLRRLLCTGIKTDTLLHQVRFPPGQRVKLTDAHAVSYQTLSTLIAYKALFDKAQADEMVGAFVKGLSRYKDTAKACIHALALACHELQPSMTKFLPEVLRGLMKIVSSASVSVHILELLGFLGQIPALYANLTEEEYKMVFGIALQYITSHNQQQQRETEAWSQGATPPRSAPAEPNGIIEEVEQAFQQYVYLMAFYTIALWFVSLKLPERKKYVTFIVRKLVRACQGQAALDEPTEVCFDMLNRYTYANAEPKPRKKHSKFNELIKSSLGKPVRTASWVVGNAILTISCLSRPGWTEVCVKRPSGLVKMIWELENLSGDHVASEQDVLEMVIRHRDTLFSAASDDGMADDQACACESGDSASPEGMRGKGREVTLESVLSQSEEITRTTGIEPNYTNLEVDPSFFALQVMPFSDGPSGQAKGRPMRVPDQPAFQRAVELIDYLPVVDFHKIGVIYVGPGQSTEAEILGNREGSKAYINFLSAIGTLIRLKGCEHYNTGGLDTREDSNGRFAYMWGDDITQICFHIATLMPTSREEQPTGPDPIMAKKALIGNDFVVIVFNDSGKEYKFDCLASQFNFINILVEPNTPINANWNLRAGVQQELKFYKISLQRKEGLPKIGPIENFKMISSSCLSEFVRRLALHANTFVQVYLGCVGTETVGRGVESGGFGEAGAARRKVEYVSNWRARLREIRRLKDRLEKRRTEEEQGKADDEVEGGGGPEGRARVGMQGPMKGRVGGAVGGEEGGVSGAGAEIDLENLARDRDFTLWAT